MNRAFLTAAIAVVTIALSPAVSLDAQQAAPRSEPANPPGWLFVPAISVAESFDNNVLLAGSGEEGDFLTAIAPRALLGYRGRQTTFRADYQGLYQLYQDLSELNTYEQRSGVDFRHRFSPYVSLFARNGITKTPTTDDIDLPGVVFRRQGVLMEDLRAGVDARFSSRTSLLAAYTFQWLDFANDPQVPDIQEFQQGGHSHGARASLQYALDKTVSLGGEFDMRHATLDARDARVLDANREFNTQNALGTVDVRLNQRYELSGGAGLSWLKTTEIGATRMAPAFRVSLSRSGERFAWVVGYRRSFLPSFGFGGTFQNEELSGNILAPLSRRLDWSAGIAYRENESLLGELPSLRSLWARSTVSYLATRWLRIEGFYSQSIQNSQRPGGRVNRMRAGVQVATSTRMRIR
jgi:hypothetical protein